MTDARGEPHPIALVDYQGHEGKIARLEEWRDSHKDEHDKHIATKAWVYGVVIGVMGVVTAAGVTLGAAAIRALLGN